MEETTMSAISLWFVWSHIFLCITFTVEVNYLSFCAYTVVEQEYAQVNLEKLLSNSAFLVCFVQQKKLKYCNDRFYGK